jgi:Fe-S-cluster containining protein
MMARRAVAHIDTNDHSDLPAGNFSSWMIEMQGAIRGEHGANVPCDGCTACCTSSQFIHIEPDETGTLAHIPPELLFPAPGMPPGHVLLGYDERGHCPMLIDDQCSIYEHRPRTCRTYDCRIFPAAGLEIDDDDKLLIARRARRWKFSYPTQADRNQHNAVRAAATLLREQVGQIPDRCVPTNTTQLAVRAIELSIDAAEQHDRPRVDEPGV